MPDSNSALLTSGLPYRHPGKSDVRSWDFPGGALPTWLVAFEDTPTGAATVGGVARDGGWYTNLSNNNSEAQQVALTNPGEILDLFPQKGAILEMVLRIPILPSAAGHDLFFGLATARNDTIGSITRFLGFRATANGNLLVSVDDGTTDQEVDTTLNLVAAQTLKLRIHTMKYGAVAATTFKVGFSVSQGDDGEWTPVLTSTTEAWTLDFSTNGCQFLLEAQKTDAVVMGYEIDRLDYFQDKNY